MNKSDSENWINLVSAHAPEAEFGAPAKEEVITQAEELMHINFPAQLRKLLLEADGVTADHGSGVVWSASEIVRHNLEFRDFTEFKSLYMPFNHLLFFGDDGGGDQFAFSISAAGQIHKPDIYRWEHETDARTWYASGLHQFFKKRL